MRWWNQNRLPDGISFMNDTNIGKCLDLYWEQIERTKVSVPSTLAPPALSSHSVDILLKLNTTPYTWNKEVNLPD